MNGSKCLDPDKRNKDQSLFCDYLAKEINSQQEKGVKQAKEKN
ncbi:MAG: hypothetical protein FD155_3413 [Bacteroidetes bacterium]|nr:MAG: hypothetical protein FD155_3413 [Bacteroidota bacterium]